MRSLRSSDGFTLVEAIVAVAILAICLIPMIGSYITAAATQNEAVHRLQALNVARAEVEELEQAGYAGAASGSHPFPTPAGTTDWPLSGYTVDVTVDPHAGRSNLKDVTVQVSWSDALDNSLIRSVTLHTSLAARP